MFTLKNAFFLLVVTAGITIVAVVLFHFSTSTNTHPEALVTTKKPLREARVWKESQVVFGRDVKVKHLSLWTSVEATNSTRFYSAYLDERNDTVLVLGLHNRSLAEREFYCAFQYPDKTSVCLEQPAKQEYLNQGDEKPHHDSWAHALSCNVRHDSPPPVYVLISTNISCDSPHSSWVPVSRRPSKDNVTFGVCIETPLFGSITISSVIEGIERNLALGAKWLTVYVQQVSPSVMKVLKGYEEDGLLEIVEWNLSKQDIANSHYYAESVCITDCLYRNMYRVKYLVFTDLDEIIVPQKHRNWGEMMLAIDQKNISAFLFSHTVFERPKKQDSQLDTFLHNWTCKGNKIAKKSLPYFISHNFRSPPWLEQNTTRRKVIAKPEYLKSMGIHFPHCWQKHSHQFVPPDMGLLYHYRVQPLCKKCKKELTRDERIQQLSPDLFTHIRNKMCHYL